MAQRVVIIGAGQNSLVAAFYLARAGHNPLVLERRPVVGGLAVTEEFHPGFRASLLDGASGPLPAALAKDMQLSRHGVEFLDPPFRVFAPSPDGRALLLHSDLRETSRRIKDFSASDATKYLELAEIFEKAGGFIRELLTITPPEIDHPSSGDIWNLLRAGRRFRGLGRKNMQRLLRWGPMAVADFVAEFFETELLRAVMAAPGIFGAAAGPWSAGTTALLLLRVGAGGFPDGKPVVVRGGMGAISEAMASAAKQAGAEIRTNAEVARISVKDGAVNGILLANGEEVAASAVISGADPRRTLLKLIELVHLAPSFVVKMQHYRSSGTLARVLLALDGLPNFTALKNSPETNAALMGRIHIGPEIDYLERAFDDSKYGDFSRAPFLSATIPSLLDPSLAPSGKHVMSVHVQFAPYRLKNAAWSNQRDALAEVVVKTLAQYAPDLPLRIFARRVITPLDLEETYGLTGGNISHGELALDQLFTMRPLLGCARYRTPIRGLFLCGSGTHPGTGLTGASGFNASREILKAIRH
ncbi:MAG TPA: NAD(P)/FAD-dependent oxidoreductase [Candidatus Acidoferrales bacterium]|nr:NAD(P)/FAD-dependent oxidoreductase [Candidatus Acidoferrales bacterium]